MIGNVDAVVIGSGALGSSVAWHLSEAGLSVAMLDRAAIGGQTSPRAAGLSAVLRPTALMTGLARRGVEKLLAFEAETGVALAVHQAGSLKLARSDALARQLDEEIERGRDFGVAVRLLTAREAHDRMPHLDASGARAITFAPDDVFLEPGSLCRAYAAAAARLGCVLSPFTNVEEVMVHGNTVIGVATSRGPIRSRVVVDAAGAWLRGVGPAAALPMVAVRHQLIVTAPFAGVANDQPITRVLDANVYVRPCDGGLMLGGYEPDPLLLEQPPADLDDVPLDRSVIDRLVASVAEEFPVFGRVPTAIFRGGLPTMTIDDEHVIGPISGVEGFYVIGGCNVGGLSTAPSFGEAMRDMVLHPDRASPLGPLLPERFAGGSFDPAAVAAGARSHYAQHYWGAAARATR